jgi:hypothetical protein
MIKMHETQTMVTLFRERKGCEYVYSTRSNDDYVVPKSCVLASIAKSGHTIHVNTYTTSDSIRRQTYRDLLLSVLPQAVASGEHTDELARKVILAAETLARNDRTYIKGASEAVERGDNIETFRYAIAPLALLMGVSPLDKVEHVHVTVTLAERGCGTYGRELIRRLDSAAGWTLSEDELRTYCAVFASLATLDHAAFGEGHMW